LKTAESQEFLIGWKKQQELAQKLLLSFFLFGVDSLLAEARWLFGFQEQKLKSCSSMLSSVLWFFLLIFFGEFVVVVGVVVADSLL
jgi:hypothetical protein